MGNCKNNFIKEYVEHSNFWIKIDCAMHSIKEVECFLHNLNKASRYVHLYKFLK